MENHTTIQKIWTVMKREWSLITSRRLYPFVMVGAPILTVAFFLSLMSTGLPKDLPTAVVDKDNSSISRRLVRTLDAFKQTDVVAHCTSFSEARKLMQEGKVYGIYYIPKNMEHDLLSFRQPKVSFYTNNAYIIAGSLEFQDLKTMSVLGSASVGKEMRTAHGKTEEQAMKELQPIEIETHPIGNPWMNYAIYLCNVIIPGILGVIIMITTVFSFGSEVKNRRSKKLIEDVGEDIFSVLIGKLLPHTLIYFLMITFIEAALYGFMGFPCKNGLASMLVSCYLYVIACQCLTLSLYALIPIMRISISLASFLAVLSFSISGFTFPVGEMHPIIQTWSNIFPLRHFFLLYVDNALNGNTFCHLWGSYVALLSFMFLPLITAGRLRRIYKYDTYAV